MGNGRSRDADSDALTTVRVRREEAEIARIRALAQEEVARMRVETARVRAERMRDTVLTGAVGTLFVASATLVVASAVALAVDWRRYGDTAVIRRRLKQQLLSGKLISSAAIAPRTLLTPAPTTYPGDFLPVMLFGPSGCGKSVYLSLLAQHLASRTPPVPVALVRFRLSHTVITDTSSPSVTGAELMKRVADQVCQQLGYPLRDPWLTAPLRFVSNFGVQFGGVEVNLIAKAAEARNRCRDALNMLFHVAHEIRTEQGVMRMSVTHLCYCLTKSTILYERTGCLQMVVQDCSVSLGKTLSPTALSAA